MWDTEGRKGGAVSYRLINLGEANLANFTLSITTVTRPAHKLACVNAELIGLSGSDQEFRPPAGSNFCPGEAWSFVVDEVCFPARRRNDGPRSAYINLPDGTRHPVEVGDLHLSPLGQASPRGRSNGEAENLRLALVPWPAEVAVTQADGNHIVLVVNGNETLVERQAVAEINSLHKRLFPVERLPFALADVPGGRALRLQPEADKYPESYRLEFSSSAINLVYGDVPGLRYGLISLAQLLRGSRRDPRTFGFPDTGRIIDGPRFGWRGLMLDTARHFFGPHDVMRAIDVAAWFKLNIFHWHLTDDEAWRIEIKSLPALTGQGSSEAVAGPSRTRPSEGFGPSAGYYRQDEVRDIVAHASDLGLTVVPEIDVPGHSKAAVAALSELTDPREPPESYRSVHGYANNCLNPGLASTYRFLATVLDEILPLFPGPYIHVGGDEVPAGAWLESPAAKSFANQESCPFETTAMQTRFMRKVEELVSIRGRQMCAWDEVGSEPQVQGSPPVLMAWRSFDNGAKLANAGYRVVVTPGQAYYLDMAQGQDWHDLGATWAGVATLRQTYAYEPGSGFGDETIARLLGVQACIWTEHIDGRDLLNLLAFPRLAAIAESAWTPPSSKAWDRFQANAGLCPQF
ncbi:beta-N-acetylhexosaminidase [Labrys sp. 22185]|uniref:beta-N-acetylhexosaminidase n=1 Tax=Labrys sp. 22185 TaxID=3453888 RepID=UPI003F86F13D